MKTILVTGGAGFIGSHFVDLVLSETEYKVVVLDKLTYAGKSENMISFLDSDRVHFIKGDICDYDLVDSIFDDYKLDYVVNFAAESHVDNSISAPDVFISSNIVGTFNLLNLARQYWVDMSGKRFIQVSTDEVYGSTDNELSFVETSLLQPNSPYSASKASGDLIARSFFVTYGVPVIITRSSNNFGPRQDKEKLIPKIIDKIVKGENISIYGTGENVRDWIFVKDNTKYLLEIVTKGLPGEIYNISSGNEISNLKVVQVISKLMDKPAKIEFVADRLGHDFRYSVNHNKTVDCIGQFIETDFRKALKETIESYIKLD